MVRLLGAGLLGLLMLVAEAAAAERTGAPRPAAPEAARPAPARPLVAPFEPILYLAAPVRPKQGCEAAPPAVKDVGTDVAPSGTDDRRLQAETVLRSLQTFATLIAGHADRYFLSRGAERKAAACALALLDSWARNGALLGQADAAGEFVREMTLASLAMNALKIRQSPDLDRGALQRVTAWLKAVAGKVMAHYADPSRPEARDHHAYWAGLGVGLAGVAAQNRALFDWAMQRLEVGVMQVQADGSLPLEMARRSWALQGQLFALAPLIMLAELGEWNGRSAYEANGGALHRLVAFTVAGVRDPKAFARRAGAPQEGVFPPANGSAELAWVEPYAARFPDRAPMDWVKTRRPIHALPLGGAISYLYSAREGP